MVKLATFGYGMIQDPKPTKKSVIFRKALVDANIDLLIDTRYNIWGGFWNPKKIEEVLEGTNVLYVYDSNEVKFHQLFGVPKSMRCTQNFAKFSKSYKQLITDESILKLEKLIERFNPSCIAVMCCEPFTTLKNNCHRFVLAEILLNAEVANSVIHLSMDKTFDRMLNEEVVKNETTGI